MMKIVKSRMILELCVMMKKSSIYLWTIKKLV
ncbi:hypothetical protein MIMI-R681 [Acanthamoeba polyphaga mimivirus]|uniref:Uncharacterized protein n=1 Tax=Acanthamoeba polyphaga mimivirus TaxID=212035 RepID=E5L7Z0_MIMIV|nr:hypothetical protein MIMI_gp0653 [Acanthamoeba polyphaga mimivirus]ADQ48142.1 hypothetical protein [Acanthamoeba polyphaga mimivirus]UTE96775.1 hypothetical protein MIMI-R681 [Acanthamoeba polyphaga mimivirus]